MIAQSSPTRLPRPVDELELTCKGLDIADPESFVLLDWGSWRNFGEIFAKSVPHLIMPQTQNSTKEEYGHILRHQGDAYDVGYKKSRYPYPDTRVRFSNVDLLSLLVVFSVPGQWRSCCLSPNVFHNRAHVLTKLFCLRDSFHLLHLWILKTTNILVSSCAIRNTDLGWHTLVIDLNLLQW